MGREAEAEAEADRCKLSSPLLIPAHLPLFVTYENVRLDNVLESRAVHLEDSLEVVEAGVLLSVCGSWVQWIHPMEDFAILRDSQMRAGEPMEALELIRVSILPLSNSSSAPNQLCTSAPLRRSRSAHRLTADSRALCPPPSTHKTVLHCALHKRAIRTSGERARAEDEAVRDDSRRWG
jgi:hypothetical protein